MDMVPLEKKETKEYKIKWKRDIRRDKKKKKLLIKYLQTIELYGILPSYNGVEK